MKPSQPQSLPHLLLLTTLLTTTLHPTSLQAKAQGQSHSTPTTDNTIPNDHYHAPLHQRLRIPNEPPVPEVAPGLLLSAKGRYEFQGPASGIAKVPQTAEQMKSHLGTLENDVWQRETRLGLNSPTKSAASLDDKELDNRIQDSARAQHAAWKLFKSEKSESFRHESVQIGILTLKYRQIADLKRDLKDVEALKAGEVDTGRSSPPLSPGSYTSSNSQEQQPSRPQPTRKPPTPKKDPVRPPRAPPKHEPVSPPQPPPLGPPRRKELSVQSFKGEDNNGAAAFSSSSSAASAKKPSAPPPRKPVTQQPQRYGFTPPKNQVQNQAMGLKVVRGSFRTTSV
ncbi:hypothetical protein CP533_6266 [Ophiocordyceps camponoti-saundersi (nom. inval.)]|nr:hypothetical protein CP533_6266 [Ophiocordyceps camponoti-saundersi (nom. inval.)]